MLIHVNECFVYLELQSRQSHVAFQPHSSRCTKEKNKKSGTQTAADSLDNADPRFCRKAVPGGPLLPMDFHPVSSISGPAASEAAALAEAIYFCDPRLFIYLFIAPKVKASERTSAFATRSSFKIDQRRMIHKLKRGTINGML